MATNIFEDPDKYFDILKWNKLCMKYVGFSLFIKICC